MDLLQSFFHFSVLPYRCGNVGYSFNKYTDPLRKGEMKHEDFYAFVSALTESKKHTCINREFKLYFGLFWSDDYLLFYDDPNTLSWIIMQYAWHKVRFHSLVLYKNRRPLGNMHGMGEHILHIWINCNILIYVYICICFSLSTL